MGFNNYVHHNIVNISYKSDIVNIENNRTIYRSQVGQMVELKVEKPVI